MVDAVAAAQHDFYELFEIDPSSDSASIRKALRTARSRWRQLTGSPDRERAQRAERSMALLDIAFDVLPDDALRAEYDAALLARRQSDRAGAQEAEAREAAPTLTTDWGARAGEYLEADDPRNALLAAKRGTEADPDDATAWLMYARAAVALEQYDEADFASAELLHRVPLAANWSYRGEILTWNKRHVEAETHFRRAAELDQEDPFFQTRAAWSVLSRGEVDAAIVEGWQVVERFPEDEFPPRLLREACFRLRRRGEPHRALPVAARLLSAAPDSDENMLQVVWSIESIAELGDLDVALTEAWRLLDAFPDGTRPINTLSYVIAKMYDSGREAQALAEARRLLSRSLDDEEARLRFAWARLRDAEAKMAQPGPDTHAILNRAQADYYAAALAEVASMNVADADVQQSLAHHREYLAQQTRTRVRLGFWKIVLAILAIALVLIGLSQFDSSIGAGLALIVVGGLLGWGFCASSFQKQYRRDAKLSHPSVRSSGLQR